MTMNLSEIKSKAELSTFIESYWQFKNVVGKQLVFFPDGTFNIFFALAPFRIVNATTCYNAGAYLMPISSLPVHIETTSDIYGIRFKAFSLLNILNKNIDGLTMLNPLEKLRKEKVLFQNSKNLFENGVELAEMVCYLENIAFDLLNKQFSVNLSLRDKVNYILDLKGQIRIEEMAKEFGLTRQALHKNFKQNLLISPKELSAIWQLNHFFTLADDSDSSLTSKALDAGYFDQAHFINAFKTRFGLSPSQFMKTKPEMFDFAKDQMVKRFSNYYDPEV